MKTAIGLQFSTHAMRLVRAAGWVGVTMAFGLILVMLFGGQKTASTSREPVAPGGQHFKQKTGPWVYVSVSTRV
jgi:hypothetical protein